MNGTIRHAVAAGLAVAMLAGLVVTAKAQQQQQVVRARAVLQQSEEGLVPQQEVELEQIDLVEEDGEGVRSIFYSGKIMTPFAPNSAENAYDLNGNGLADDPVVCGEVQVAYSHVRAAHSMLKGGLEGGLRAIELEGEHGVEYRAVIDNAIREIDEASAELENAVEKAVEEAVETEESGD